MEKLIISEVSFVLVYKYGSASVINSNFQQLNINAEDTPIRNIDIKTLPNLLAEQLKHSDEGWIAADVKDDVFVGGVSFLNGVKVQFDLDKIIVKQSLLESLPDNIKRPDIRRVGKIICKQMAKKLNATALGINFDAHYELDKPDDFMKNAVAIGNGLNSRLHTSSMQLVYDYDSEDKLTSVTINPVIIKEGSKSALGFKANFHHSGTVLKRMGIEKAIDDLEKYEGDFKEIVKSLVEESGV